MTVAEARGVLGVEHDIRPSRLSLPVKLAYGFGSLAYGVKDNGFSTLLLLFYNQVVGLPAQWVGLAIFIALVLDAFIDPTIGYLSDRLQTRWGRRHPFMYASAIPVGLLYLLLWSPPVGASHLVILVYLVGVAILVRTAISCYEVPSAALAPELSSDYHERTSILGWRYLFGWIGGMGMLLLTFLVFLAPSARFPVGQLNPAGYRTYAVVASAVMTAAILLSALGTHGEVKRRLKPTQARRPVSGPGSIARVLKNRAFVILLVSGMFIYTIQGLNFALGTYFSTFLWGLPASSLAAFTVGVIIGVGLSFAFSKRASRRWGKRNAAVAATLAYLVLATAPFLLRLVGWFPPNGAASLLPLLMAFNLVSTVVGVAATILSASMMADVVEDSEARTGEREEGLFFAGAFFMQKCVSGLGLFMSGTLLALVRFPAAAVPGKVPLAVLDHLVIIYCGVTVLLGLFAVAVLVRFPLGEADHRRRVAELADVARHASPLPGSEPEPALGL